MSNADERTSDERRSDGSTSGERPPWHPTDRVALSVGLVFPLLLLVLWLTGHGPWDQRTCRTETVKTEIVKETVTKVTRALHLDLERTDGRIVLYGAVGSESDRRGLADAAAAQLGAANVVDRISVDPAVEPLAWVSSAPDLLARLEDLGDGARFKIDGTGLTVSGVVDDEVRKDTAAQAAVALLGKDATLRNDVVVKKPSPPPAAEVKPEPAPAPAPAPEPAAPEPAAPKPAASEPAAAPPPPPAEAAAETRTEPAPPRPADLAPPADPAPAESAGGSGLVKHTLPNGVVIEVASNGLERQAIAFIEDAAKPVDKSLWFDFDRLYFQTGSAQLTDESKAQVQALAEVLKAYPGTAIKIGGYTDNVGDPVFNQQLSSARADRVMKELIALGISGARLESEGYGMQHPAANNATEEGRAKNRRTAVSVRRK